MVNSRLASASIAAMGGSCILTSGKESNRGRRMPAATLTSKGQLTLPKQVRELLKVDTGDAVDFIIGGDGEIRVRAAHVDVRELRGLLHKSGRRPVTLDEMDRAIGRGRGSRT